MNECTNHDSSLQAPPATSSLSDSCRIKKGSLWETLFKFAVIALFYIVFKRLDSLFEDMKGLTQLISKGIISRPSVPTQFEDLKYELANERTGDGEEMKENEWTVEEVAELEERVEERTEVGERAEEDRTDEENTSETIEEDDDEAPPST